MMLACAIMLSCANDGAVYLSEANRRAIENKQRETRCRILLALCILFALEGVLNCWNANIRRGNV
jgi:hypothetical protein